MRDHVFWELCGLVSDQNMSACSNGVHETKPIGDSLTGQEPADFGAVQNTAGTIWPAHSLLSPNIHYSSLGF